MVSQVAVQQRQRLLREGLAQLLAAVDDIEVVGTAATAHELIEVCAARPPTIVVVEVDGEAEVARLVAALRRVVGNRRDLRVVGLTDAVSSAGETTLLRRAGLEHVVCRAAGFADILAAVRNDAPTSATRVHAHLAPSKQPYVAQLHALTARELTILGLIGAGLTSREVSRRLDISHKTVENHKQRMFGKLGVQSQAHAVAVAMRTGLMNPDHVIDLAAAD